MLRAALLAVLTFEHQIEQIEKKNELFMLSGYPFVIFKLSSYPCAFFSFSISLIVRFSGVIDEMVYVLCVL